MPILKSFFISLICLIFCTQAFALRCGNQIVSVGDVPNKVLTTCGKPIKIIKAKANKHQASQIQWLYNFGPQDFVYRLTFSKNKLMAIEILGYGR